MDHQLREVGFLAVGALLGFLSSLAMWKFQVREQRRQKRADHILHAIELALSSLTYMRALLYSKVRGIKAVISLPANPVDELMPLALLHIPEVLPLVQQLHDKQQDLFAHGNEAEDAADSMLNLVNEFPPLVNKLIKQLGDLAERAK